MEYRQLGTTGMQVSAIGVGGYSFGPPMLGQAEVNAVVNAALEHGINFFDTSDVYGHGKSEDLLGVGGGGAAPPPGGGGTVKIKNKRGWPVD
jgi:aryl-alcohol dehydrogenase-like predicted oxidoreductase